MKNTTIIAIAASILAAAPTTAARDAENTTGMPAVSSPQTVEYTPLTRSERLRDYLKGTFGPSSLLTSAARAGLDHALDRPGEWDSGGRGFGNRLGNVYAKHIIRQTLQFGAAATLHEDDRYLASGQTGFWSRTKYAVASAFLARRENGDRCFAAARVAAGQRFRTSQRRHQFRIHHRRRHGNQRDQGILA